MSTYFTANIAPGIIIGSSIFSIFWGCVNAMLVSINKRSSFMKNQILNDYVSVD